MCDLNELLQSYIQDIERLEQGQEQETKTRVAKIISPDFPPNMTYMEPSAIDKAYKAAMALKKTGSK